MSNARIVIFANKEELEQAERDKLYSAHLIAYGLPNGNFFIWKNRRSGRTGEIHPSTLNWLIEDAMKTIHIVGASA